MGLKLSINGKDYTNLADLSGVQLEHGFNSDNTFESAVSTPIELKGEACDLIKETFLNDCDLQVDNSLYAVVTYDKCGGVAIPLSITAEGVEDCPLECTCKARISSLDEAKRCYRKLSNTFVTFDGFLDYKKHPRVRYCVQPTIMGGLLFFLGVLLIPAITIILAVFNVLERICKLFENLINFLINIPIIGDRILDNAPQFIQDLINSNGDLEVNFCPEIPSIGDYLSKHLELLSGCGYFTPTYLVRDIFSYHSERCGLEFKSSIFNTPASPYYNTTLWCQPNDKGGYRDEDVNFIAGNEPNRTVIELLEQIKRTMPCTDYKIIDGCLYFEREEFFYQAKKEILNVVEKADGKDINPCYTYNIEGLCIGTEFSFARDAIEGQGNRLMPLYSDYVRYGQSASDSLKDLCRVQSPFSPVRGMFDCETADRTGFFDLDYIIDVFRKIGQIDTGIGFLDNAFDNIFDPRDCDMIIQDHTAANCKLIVLESGFDPCDAKISKKVKGEFRGRTTYYYNPEFYYDAAMESGCPELINNFGDCLDPNKKRDKYLMDDLTVKLDCDLLDCVLNNKLGNYITTHYGRAFYDTATIDFDSCRVTFKGLVVWC